MPRTPGKLSAVQAWRSIAQTIVGLPNLSHDYFLCNNVERLAEAGVITDDVARSMYRQIKDGMNVEFQPEDTGTPAFHDEAVIDMHERDAARDTRGPTFSYTLPPDFVVDRASREVRIFTALVLAEQARRP